MALESSDLQGKQDKGQMTAVLAIDSEGYCCYRASYGG